MQIDQSRKLLMSFNMRSGVSGEAYYRFVLGDYIPQMQKYGLDMVEAWGTAYGNGPDRLIAFMAQDGMTVSELLINDDWHELNDQLLEYVTDFSYKVIPFRQGFQL